MPRRRPPDGCPGTTLIDRVPARAVLWRAHSESHWATAFNATPRPRLPAGAPVPGGRFDSADGSYSYIYLARSAGGALAESFARHLDYTRAGPRPLLLAKVAGKKISSVVVKRDLRVVVAYGAGAEQLGQDMWLTTCDEDNYSLAREWAVAVRRWEPGADGLVWKSRRDPAEEVFVLWGDPSTAGQGCGLLEVAPIVSEHLAWGPAWVMFDQWLVQWRLYLEPLP